MSIIEYELRKNKQNGRPYMREIRKFDSETVKGSSPEDIANFLQSVYEVDTLVEEEVYVLFLSTQMEVVAVSKVAHGGFSQVCFGKREILCRALILGAVGLVLVHNHPEGKPIPSKEDTNMTNEFVNACDTVGIRLLDHVIIANKGIYSYRQEGIVTFR